MDNDARAALRRRVLDWAAFIAMGDSWKLLVDDRLFLDLHLYDIPATITRTIAGFSRWPQIEAVSVHKSCMDAALAGQVNGHPRIELSGLAVDALPKETT